MTTPAETYDLKTPEGIAALMRTSKTEADWNANADKIKEANALDGKPAYPCFWWDTIVRSGLIAEVTNKF